jgi:hypothetical protein
MTSTTIRRSCAAAAALGLAAVLPAQAAAAPTTPAPSASATATTCKADAELRLMPGIGLEDGTGSFYSRPNGKVTCDGPVMGRRLTGPGVYTSAGRLGTEDPDSCVKGGEGWFALRWIFPTDKGEVEFASAGTFTYGAMKDKGPLTGTFKSDFVSGTFTLIPVKGDCVSGPVTVGRVLVEATMHKFRGPA